MCESRLITLKARSAREALAAARRYGKRESFWYLNPYSERYVIQFIGVADLDELTHAPDREVWHWMYETLNPRGQLRPVSQFRVFRKGGIIGDAWEAVPREVADPTLLKSPRPRVNRRRGVRSGSRARHARA